MHFADHLSMRAPNESTKNLISTPQIIISSAGHSIRPISTYRVQYPENSENGTRREVYIIRQQSYCQKIFGAVDPRKKQLKR